jgi:hypothetical protein
MKKFITITILLVLLSVTGYFSFIYFIPYSKGVRAGELIKISRKGVLCKTWEGEISQGISGAQIFPFSVEDREIDVIEGLQNFQGKYVKVYYKERYKTFFWLGDSKYFIYKVEREESPHFRK